MANFKSALDKVLVKEGGYVNDPDDAGGETYRGVSRRFWKNWEGWKIIDDYKENNKVSNKEFTNILNRNVKLQKEVYSFYKSNFWDCFELDDVPNQRVAEMMFDTAINQGAAAAIKFAERTLNLRETGKWSLNLLNKLVTIK